MGHVIFIGNMEPLIQRESFKRFEGNRLVTGIREKVQAEVISLRSLEREAVIQFFWEGLPIDEIAARMRIRQNSVRKLLEMALATLKRRLADADLGRQPVPA